MKEFTRQEILMMVIKMILNYQALRQREKHALWIIYKKSRVFKRWNINFRLKVRIGRHFCEPCHGGARKQLCEDTPLKTCRHLVTESRKITYAVEKLATRECQMDPWGKGDSEDTMSENSRWWIEEDEQLASIMWRKWFVCLVVHWY